MEESCNIGEFAVVVGLCLISWFCFQIL